MNIESERLYKMREEIYDLIIIGGGPAGLSAGIYAGRAMLDTLILEKEKVGGQVTTTTDIVNYPGVRKTTGPKLMEEMYDQIKDFGVDLKVADITSVELTGEIKKIHTANGTYEARSIIIATGAAARKIGFPGEVDFTGRGIAYCSTCDGEFFSGLDIFVIGGGYAAAEEAIYLTRYGKSVTMIIREPDFTCAKMTADQARNHPNIKVIYNTEVKEVSGDSFMNKAVFVNNETGEEFTYEAPEEDGAFGMFVFAGTAPQTGLFKEEVNLDGHGYIPTNENMETNIPGVYAAGDILPKELRQIVTAVSDGAIAATAAQKFVAGEKQKLELPMVTERMTQRLEELAKNIDTKEEPKETVTEQAKSSSNEWFPAEMKEQLKGVFGKLTKKVTLLTFTQANDAKSLELTGFLQEIAALSDKLTLKDASSVEQNVVEATRFPALALLDEQDNYTGIKFTGVPSGHELNSLVLAIYNVGSEGQPLESTKVDKIKALPKTKVQICVSLSCHYCPDVVAACQRIAALNPGIEAEMVDISLAPELKKEKKIMSIPAMIINDEEVVFGAKKMDEIIEIIGQKEALVK